MPGYKRPYDKGTLFCKFEVTFPPPNWISKSQFPALEALLPPRQVVQTPAGHVEEVVLSDVDHTRQKRQEDAMDEDEGQGGGPQVLNLVYCRFNVPINKKVQCANKIISSDFTLPELLEPDKASRL
jgi:hypothetical protein